METYGKKNSDVWARIAQAHEDEAAKLREGTKAHAQQTMLAESARKRAAACKAYEAGKAA